MTASGKSILAQLLNLAKKENIAFQLVIIRYFHERLLYRLSISRYANSFFLKGGTLLYYYTRKQTRPTMDIDFLGFKMANDIDSVSPSLTVHLCN
jgi:predicted nucleotidyltransferase component of viral defense system